MDYKEQKLLNRITLKPDVLGGKPTIRGNRFLVTDILELISAGVSEKEILGQHPILKKKDIEAALLYSSLIDRKKEVFFIPKHMKKGIRQGMEDIKNGNFITMEEFEKRYQNLLK